MTGPKSAGAAKRGTRLDALERVHPHDRAEWRAWLATHHATSPGVWLVHEKKHARPDRLPYADAVEEALCFGWIDSTVRSVDDRLYVQLYTPRNPGSTWSKVNKARVARLAKAGLMADAGRAVVAAAKRSGAWTSLDAVESLEVPHDLAKALRAHPGASGNFAAFPASARKAYLHWVLQAKREETRARRVAEVAELAAANRKFRGALPG
jgi:uncharacterized protein YdeI (YjbR/CyaY-like superfamily)